MRTLLIADSDKTRRGFLAAQLDADGHTVYEARSVVEAIAKLSEQAIDVLILGELARTADASALTRMLRAGQLDEHFDRGQPIVTIGAVDELSTLRAYEAGSDHHFAGDVPYLVLRVVIDTVARRASGQVVKRFLEVDGLRIDTAARVAQVNGKQVQFKPCEFDVLTTLASEPTRVFSKADLARRVWGPAAPVRTSRTVESHICRVRGRLRDAGADMVHNRHGAGWALKA